MIRLNSHCDYDCKYLEAKLDEQLKLILPGLVAENIITSLPTYLRDNSKIKKIVDLHLEDVRRVTTEEIEKIVNEPEYHLTHKAFFESIEEKANERVDSTLSPMINLRNDLSDLQDRVNNLMIVSGLAFGALFVKTIFF